MKQKNSVSPLFGIQVKKKLIELNMTQRELARDIGVNENYLTDILRGRRSGRKYKDAIIQRLDLETEEKQSRKMKGVV
ncbi:MAG TPA: helix-turn-helix domain-containing protein [Bacillus bacterium]|nr:helix-turn-helix domain-containing protein [Bacillus sp. (in: firmicutes)]